MFHNFERPVFNCKLMYPTVIRKVRVWWNLMSFKKLCFYMQDVVSLLAPCQKHKGLLMRSNSPWYMWAILSLSFIQKDFVGQKSLQAAVHLLQHCLLSLKVSSPSQNLFNTKKCSISLCRPKRKRQVKILDRGNLYLYIKVLKTLIFQEES